MNGTQYGSTGGRLPLSGPADLIEAVPVRSRVLSTITVTNVVRKATRMEKSQLAAMLANFANIFNQSNPILVSVMNANQYVQLDGVK
jgi:hypothetical protein